MVLGGPKPQPRRSASSAGTHSQAGSSNPQPRKALLVPSARKECRHSFPGRQLVPSSVILLQVMFTCLLEGMSGASSHGNGRQTVLSLSPGRSVGRAGTHSKAGSANPPARKECRQCRHSFPGRQC